MKPNGMSKRLPSAHFSPMVELQERYSKVVTKYNGGPWIGATNIRTVLEFSQFLAVEQG